MHYNVHSLVPFLFVTFILHESGAEKGGNYCTFNATTEVATCRGQGTMDTIPELSPNVTHLIISYGKFSNVTRNTFLNLTQDSIKVLKMTSCGIKFIAKDAFKNFTKMEHLDLSRNYEGLSATNIAEMMSHSLSHSKIRHLSFNYMGWNELPPKMFVRLISTNITTIELTHNFIAQIKEDTFRPLKSLQKLDLSWNGITDIGINFTGMSQLKKLGLAGNWFLFFPNFCDKNNKSIIPNLVELHLENSKILSLHKPITCLDNLENLNLAGLSLRLLYANTFAQLKKLRKLTLSKLGSQLFIINSTAFNSSSLEDLAFSVAVGYHFTEKNTRHFNLSGIFIHCRNLTRLDLSYNKLKLSDTNLMKMFQPLSKLKTLILQDMHMHHIPDNLGEIFPDLEYLDLSNNKIKTWNRPFANFTKLKNLYLNGNKISTIHDTSFPTSWMTAYGTLKKLRLNGNPFVCNCDLTWFRQWIDRSKGYNISTDKEEWLCSDSNIAVLNYFPERTAYCLLTYIVTSFVALFIILFSCFIVYTCRWRIRLKIYKWRRKRGKYKRLSNSDQCLYDCYVVYSYDDINWIKTFLIPNMEDVYNRRLCINDRDFPIGVGLSNHMINSIESSRAVLFIISDNFTRDKWCHFQLDVARHMYVTEGKPIMIPILLQDISFKYITGSVYEAVYNISSCLRWTEGRHSEELFWAGILDAIPISEEYSDLRVLFSEQSVDTLDSGIQESLMVNS
jgi:Leucine-rich repeat (LRR) protein